MELSILVLCYFAGVWFIHLMWWRQQKNPPKGYFKTLLSAMVSPFWTLLVLIGQMFKRVGEFFLEIFK